MLLTSRSQESRDKTRSTLGQLCVMLGARYFKLIIVELRGALKRGYQVCGAPCSDVYAGVTLH